MTGTNALTQAGIKTHCDINALHLLNDHSGSDNCPTEDQLHKAAKVLLGYQAASHFNGASLMVHLLTLPRVTKTQILQGVFCESGAA
jgi:hypothetical protein